MVEYAVEHVHAFLCGLWVFPPSLVRALPTPLCARAARGGRVSDVVQGRDGGIMEHRE